MKSLVLALAASLLASTAHAEITDRSAAGFELRQTATIAAPKARAYAAFLTPGLWWNSAHSWSGDAKNLSIDLAKGCLCETLPNGGFVRHLGLIYADGAQLRFEGALGPLVFTGATGHLLVAFKDDGANTAMTLTYALGGYAKGGLAETWAGPVDGVLAEQVARFKRYVETGKPE